MTRVGLLRDFPSKWFLAGLLALALMVPGAVVHAQIPAEDLIDPGPRNAEVQEAMAWERVDEKVIYLRPSANFNPDGSLEIAIPEKPKSDDAQDAEGRSTLIAIFAVILIVVLVIIFLQSSRIQVGFGKSREKTRAEQRTASPEAAAAMDADDRSFLDRIAAMADRREALILLVSRALERSAEMNAMTLGRAQTGRDVIRTLPQDWRHRETLRDLVRQAEVVHFGGRDISEDRWQDCLSAARPLFGTLA